MPTGIVNSSQEIPTMQKRRRKYLFLPVFFSFVFVASSPFLLFSFSQEARRIIVIPPQTVNDEIVAGWLKEDEKPKEKKDARTRFNSLLQETPEKPDKPPTGEQLQAYAGVVFAQAFQERLLSRVKVSIVPEDNVQDARQRFGWQNLHQWNADKSRRLCQELQADTLLQISEPRIELRAKSERDVIVRIGVVVPYSSRAEGGAPFRWRAASVAGSDTTGRNLFRGTYNDLIQNQVKAAAQQAARRAVHLLLTDPKTDSTENLFSATWAILPTLAPLHADRLQFTPQGRAFQENAIRGLPHDVSELFAPNLLPIEENKILSAGEMRTLLAKRKISANVFWQTPSQPHIIRIQEWAQAGGVEFVLMAHVSSLEMTESPMEGKLTEREGRAEAQGALVRVSDGKILWQERAEATLRVRPRLGQLRTVTDREILRDATKFALLELKRQLNRFFAQSEQ
jgi:hypothetical protein